MSSNISLMNVLATGTLLYVLRIVYKIFHYVTVPANMRHYPRVPITTSLRYLFKALPYEQLWRNEFRDKYKTSKYVVAFAVTGWEIHICDVEAAKYVITNYDQFHHRTAKDYGTVGNLIDKYIGDNVVLADGEVWHRQRVVINKAFNGLKPTSAAAEAATHMIGNLRHKAGQSVNIDSYMRRAMFRALLNAIFDLPELIQGERDEEISSLIDKVFMAGQSPFWLLFPYLDRPWNPLRKKVWGMQQELDALIYSIIQKKNDDLNAKGDAYDPTLDKDLISLVLNANRDPEGSKITEQEIIDNVKVLFLAGHETTASGISFVFQLLAIHQDVQNKVREEVFRVLGSKPGQMKTPTPDQQRELEYLNAVVREANRLYGPSGQLNNRYTSQDVTLPDGTFLAKNTKLTVDQWAMLRSDKIWSDPEAFKPERHLGDVKEGRTNIEYIVFSSGKRICPGMNLANIEQRIMLALCVQMFRWELADPADAQIKTGPFWVVRPTNANLKVELLT
jgi:cytochrome P450